MICGTFVDVDVSVGEDSGVVSARTEESRETGSLMGLRGRPEALVEPFLAGRLPHIIQAFTAFPRCRRLSFARCRRDICEIAEARLRRCRLCFLNTPRAMWLDE